MNFDSSSIYGTPGYMPIAGSRRAAGDDDLAIMVDNIMENNSFRTAAERRALYGCANPLWDPDILRKLKKQRIEEAASKKLLLWPGNYMGQ